MFRNRILNPFYSPEDVLDKVEEVKPTVKPEKVDDDTTLIDELIGDKDLLDMDEQEEKEEKPEEEEQEEELETPEIEVESARGVDLTKIKEKYPDFAKTNDFRELRNAYHREAKYTELFPTLEDAKEAAENNETFNKLNNDLVNNGDAASLLTSLKEASPESFKKVTTGILDTIAKIDGNSYLEIIGPVIRKLAKQIYNDGKSHLNKDPNSDDGKALVATGRNIMHYAFQNADDVDKDEPRPDPRIAEKERELQGRELSIRQEKFASAYTLTENSVERNLDKQILSGLDPDGKLNDFTRDALLDKIKNEVKSQIEKDSTHLRRMTSLWKRAESEGYSRESLSRIASAYLERARPIIPTVRNKFRSTAMKNSVTRDETDKSIKLVTRGRSGKAPANDGKVNMKLADPKKIDYSKTSDADIFEGNVKLKG